MRRSLWFAVFLLLPGWAAAEDIDARTMGAVSDLLSTVSPQQPPAGADAAVYAKAVEALRKAGLAGAPRPQQPGDAALLKAYGNALLLGPRAAQFAAEIGKVNDAAVSGDRDALILAIKDVFKAAGRSEPRSEALEKLVAATMAVVGGEPVPTVNRSLEGDGYRIDIADAVAAGRTSVEVTLKDGGDGQTARVVFEGEAATQAAPGGGLERRVKPLDPCVVSPAKSARIRDALNGDWTAADGRPWIIAGSGNSITLTEILPSGHKVAYQGSFHLAKVDARHAITDPADMGEDLPIKVRKQLAGMSLFFTLKLETCRPAAQLTGRWGSQNVTYGSLDQKVSEVHDPYDEPVTLSRKIAKLDYRITRLDIVTAGLGYTQSEHQVDVRLAQDDVARATEELRRLETEWDAKRGTTARAYRAFLDAEAAYKAAAERLAGYAPAEAEKPAAFKAMEQRRMRLQRRLDMLYDGIMLNRGHVIADSAFETYRGLQAELDRLDGEIAAQRRALGFDDAKAGVAQALEDAFVAQLRAQSQLDGAALVQDLARDRIDAANLSLAQAKAKLSEVEQKLAGFTAGLFTISGVEAEEGATMRYEVEAWDPSEVLTFLDQEIARLGSVLVKADARRREARAEFLAAHDAAHWSQLHLADRIMTSAIAQGVTELAFNTADVVEKTLEAGPVGGLGEGAKKVVEALVLGPPSFYEPSLAPMIMTGEGGPFSDIRENLRDVAKYSGKRAAKSAVSSPTASLIVKKYLLARDTRVFMEAIGEVVEGTAASGYRFIGATQGEMVDKAFTALTKAQAGMKDAVSEGLFRNFAGLTQLSFKEAFEKAVTSPQPRKLAHSMGRDLAKMATKKVLAEWLEGVPLAEFLALEAEARLRTQIFLAASGIYWEAYDPYHARVEQRREILRQFDAKNKMHIVTDLRFGEGADLLIVLRDAAGKPISAPDHRITVKLGGRTAERLGQDQLFYRVAATELAHDDDGGVALEIVIED